MKFQFAAGAAVLALLGAPAFAQGNVQSATGVTVLSSSGVVVTPGVGTMAPTTAPVAGASMVEAGKTVTVAGNTTTTTTTYWANVPANVTQNGNFQRWQALK